MIHPRRSAVLVVLSFQPLSVRSRLRSFVHATTLDGFAETRKVKI